LHAPMLAPWRGRGQRLTDETHVRMHRLMIMGSAPVPMLVDTIGPEGPPTRNRKSRAVEDARNLGLAGGMLGRRGFSPDACESDRA
jgi:hypothetical protein